jgi:EAL domain-containing protein (putative c-di-GMP-specific phosphodiesterase class I)
VRAVLSGTGRSAVLQPVVDVVTGRVVAAEALTRFTAASRVQPGPDGRRSPAQWFDDASRLGRRSELEAATAAAALDLLDATPADVTVCVNLGPDTLLGELLAPLLAGRPLHRVVVERTEHAPVHHYDALSAVLLPYRAKELRLAIDDAGAGYASLRHVLAVRPDLIKIDMALTRGADVDLARQTLLSALASFGHATGCRLVAEGVETLGELRAVAACGVDLAQGYALAAPSAEPDWTDRSVVAEAATVPRR